jgi:uncharacterized iron-regulated membrane protein
MAGVVIFVLSLTGLLLAYERQIVAFSDSPPPSVPPSESAEPMPVGTLLDRVVAAHPGTRPIQVTLRSDRTAPVTVVAGREATLYVDAYSGAVLGTGSQGARNFLRGVKDWHRWLAAGGTHRASGRSITGAANLAFLFLVLSGSWLWWPRKRTWRHVRTVTLFQTGLGGRARDFNWHNVAGFWTALPLLLILVTGAVMSYPWANDLLYRVAGSEPPPPRSRAAAAGLAPEGQRGTAFEAPAGINRVLDASAARVRDWRSLTVRLPDSPMAPLAVAIDRSDGAARPDLRSSLSLDPITGDVLKFEPYASQSAGRRLRTWVRFTHTGEAGGLAGQTAAALASAGGALLVWSGLSLALRRFRSWRSGTATAPVSGSREPTGPLGVTS